MVKGCRFDGIFDFRASINLTKAVHRGPVHCPAQINVVTRKVCAPAKNSPVYTSSLFFFVFGRPSWATLIVVLPIPANAQLRVIKNLWMVTGHPEDLWNLSRSRQIVFISSVCSSHFSIAGFLSRACSLRFVFYGDASSLVGIGSEVFMVLLFQLQACIWRNRH